MIRQRIKPIVSRLGMLTAAKQLAFRFGYQNAETEILSMLCNTTLLDRFRTCSPLPDGYGLGWTERIIEYPWAFAQISPDARCVLDAGSVLNHDYLMPHIRENSPLSHAKIYIITLRPERQAFWQHGISYIYDDLRSMPFRDAMFDVILCLSTLEHIGFDNVRYTHDPRHYEHSPDDFITAMRELWRTLQPGGQLLLTVPFGKHVVSRWWQQFDRVLLDRAVGAVGNAMVKPCFFRYYPDGWQISDADACADAEYVDYFLVPAEQRQAPPPKQSDGAKAARAVACVQLQKR